MAQEPPNQGIIDNVKRTQGILSFRSRKLLNSFSNKGGSINEVDKLLSSLSSERAVLPAAREEREIQLGSNEVLAEESSRGSARAKTLRELGDPKKFESECNSNIGKSKNRKASKQQAFTKGKPGKEGKVQNVETVSPSIPTKEQQQQLPARFKLLQVFYEALEAALSLLRIRRQMCTFKAVCKTVESISKRRFLLRHLAQIKHIFSEVLQVEHVKCRDPDSWGENWDLKINLLSLPADCAASGSPLKGSTSQAGHSVRRRKEFHARLLKFASTHPEDAEIPQGPMPPRPSVGSQEGPLRPVPSLNTSGSKVNAVVGSPSAHGEIKEDSFSFCIVKKPSMPLDATLKSEETPHLSASFKPFFSVKQKAEANDVVPAEDLEGTSHFSGSFKPFFSAKHTNEANDGVPAREFEGTSHFPTSFKPFFSAKRATDVSPDLTAECLKGTPHFPASFEPFFSARQAAEVGDVAHVGLSEIIRTVEPQPELVSYVEEDEEGEQDITKLSETQPESTSHGEEDAQDIAGLSGGDASSYKRVLPLSPRVEEEETGTADGTSRGEELFPSTVSIGASNQAEIPSKSHPGFKSVFSLSSLEKDMPSSPNVQHVLSPASVTPMHSPCFLSPMSNFSSGQASSHFRTPLTKCSSDSVPPKSQSAARALRFGSPVASSRPARALKDADTVPRTPSVNGVLINSSQTDKSGGTYLLHHQAASTQPSTPGNDFQSRLRNAIQASAPSTPATPAPSTPQHDDVSFLKSPVRNSKSSLHFSTPTKGCYGDNLVHDFPSTPEPSTPIRAAHTKEILFSPPKRTKLNCVSLFGKEEVDQGMSSLSVTGGVVEIQNSEAIVGSGGGKNTLGVANVLMTQSPLKALQSSASGDITGFSESDLDIIKSLPLDLVHSVLDKERKIKDEDTMELAIQKRRQQMMGGIPKLFNQLRLIFQSLNRSVLPRNELLKNVLASHPDITDRGEVEERLQLLIELAPDWMTASPSQNGELLYRIDKRANVVRIQRRLSIG